MPRVPSVYSNFFYGPLTEDVEDLLARFQHMDSVRFADFSSIWRDMSFSDVFFGISSSGDMRRFSRITLATAVKFFLPPYSFQIRVGGLYLMFAFYHTQLLCPPLKIRLALKDWAQVQNFLRDSLNGQHYDVVYIYRKLLAAKAFHYTAMPHVLAFQKQQKPQTEEDCSEFLSRSTVIQELMSSDLLEEMRSIHCHYEKLKEATVETSCKVSMAHQDFTTHLAGCMSEFIAWQQKTAPLETRRDRKVETDDEKEADEEESSIRAKLLSSIKKKSYSNFKEVSKSRRHRQLEVVDLSSLNVQQVQEPGISQKKRPVSLKARTQKKLVVREEKSVVQTWLLSAPEGTEGVPLKR
uniref:snRNA-activating protein complex subunit 1-like n=2 Tax=Kryptolebias marmoratus TaxID=37003 RepID=A0A3Q2ZMQ6_KRYMA